MIFPEMAMDWFWLQWPCPGCHIAAEKWDLELKGVVLLIRRKPTVWERCELDYDPCRKGTNWHVCRLGHRLLVSHFEWVGYPSGIQAGMGVSELMEEEPT